MHTMDGFTVSIKMEVSDDCLGGAKIIVCFNGGVVFGSGEECFLAAHETKTLVA